MAGGGPDLERPMESELKLELDAAAYDALMALRAPGDEPVEQINTFYDSSSGDLRRARCVLRLRRQGDRAWLTVKGAHVRQEQGYFVRPESEVEIPRAEAAALATGFRLSACLHAPVRELLETAGDILVTPFCAFVNYRTRVRLQGWSVDLDRTLMGSLVLYELEMEGQGPGRDLREWLHSRGIAWRPAARTKLAAAESLRQGAPAMPGPADRD